MTKNELNNEYFEWMCQLVCDEKYPKRLSYRKLLTYLNGVEFIYTIGLDENRYVDGIDLRYRFAYERSYDDSLITAYLDDHPCSVLEMMVALALRCEEHIMDDPYEGNRMGQWFWSMIVNLGLDSMNDNAFDERYVHDVVLRLLNREYKRNGEGGLFTVDHCKYDLRSVEIWYQMCWYLASIL